MINSFLLLLVLLLGCNSDVVGTDDSIDDDTGIDCPLFSVANIYGGHSADYFDNIQVGSSTNIVLGFSLSGSILPQGCGTLTYLEFNTGVPTQIEDIVFSSSASSSVNVSYVQSDNAGCNLPINSVSLLPTDNVNVYSVNYNVNVDLSGFQFKVKGHNTVLCNSGLQICSFNECSTSGNYFNSEINDTGESTLIILQNTINSLNISDDIGIFDNNGIIDENGTIGAVLVGRATWLGNQLNITAVMSQDLSGLGGPILPGAINLNEIIIKVWSHTDQSLKSNIVGVIDSGTGTFNGLFTAYSELSILE